MITIIELLFFVESAKIYNCSRSRMFYLTIEKSSFASGSNIGYLDRISFIINTIIYYITLLI